MGKLSFSRRSVLSGLAAAPLTGLPVVASPAIPVSCELRHLIDAHSRATAHFEAMCLATDHLDDPSLSPAWREANVAEERARTALLACPLHELADVRALALHFAKRLSPDMGDFAEPWAAEILIRNLAMMEV